MAGSATRSAILSLGSSQARGGAYSVFDAFFSSDRYTHLPYPFPSHHTGNLATLHIYMYVGRSIELNHPSNASLPRDARVCVCAVDSQAVHHTFLIPPDPALVSRRQPSSAGHDDLQISHPIFLPIFLPHPPPVRPITTTYVSAHCGPTAAAPTTPSVRVPSVSRGGHGYGVGTILVSVVAMRSSAWRSP